MKKRLFALLTLILIATSADSRAEVRGIYHHASSMTIVGAIQSNSSVTAGGFFGNGSDLTGVTAPKVFVSTTLYSTTAAYYSTTQNTPIACVTGSTLTFTTTAGMKLRVGYNGAIERTGSNLEVNMSFRFNGGWYAPLSATIHPQSLEGIGGFEVPYSWGFIIAPSAGTHTTCLLLWTGGGTAEIPQNDAVTFFVEQVN